MRLRRVIIFAGVALAAGGLAIFLRAQSAIGTLSARMVAAADAPSATVVIVPGASVLKSGQPSDILEDRLLTALALYDAGKVKKFLLSGDHGTAHYDEVSAMRSYVLAAGVPAADIFLDYAGFDTYDTMHRARSVFGVTDALVATQSFHLPRALYIGQHLGITVHGVPAERRAYLKNEEFAFRERFANVKAYLDVLRGAAPRYGGAIIDIAGDGRASWDDAGN